jgi:hypothetical protein
VRFDAKVQAHLGFSVILGAPIEMYDGDGNVPHSSAPRCDAQVDINVFTEA